jgi:hypothetical protein
MAAISHHSTSSRISLFAKALELDFEGPHRLKIPRAMFVMLGLSKFLGSAAFLILLLEKPSKSCSRNRRWWEDGGQPRLCPPGLPPHSHRLKLLLIQITDGSNGVITTFTVRYWWTGRPTVTVGSGQGAAGGGEADDWGWKTGITGARPPKRDIDQPSESCPSMVNKV